MVTGHPVYDDGVTADHPHRGPAWPGHRRGDRRIDLPGAARPRCANCRTRRPKFTSTWPTSVYCDLAGLRAIVRLASPGGGSTGRPVVLHKMPEQLRAVLEIIGWDAIPGLTVAEPGASPASRASVRPARRVRRAAAQVVPDVLAEPPGLVPVQQRTSRRPGKQRPQRGGAAPGPGDEPALQPPAQRRAHGQGQPAGYQRHPAPVRPRPPRRPACAPPTGPAARIPYTSCSSATSLISMPTTASVSTSDLDRRGGQRQEHGRADRGADRRGRPGRALDQLVGQLLRGQPGKLGAQHGLVADRQPGRHREHLGGQPAAARGGAAPAGPAGPAAAADQPGRRGLESPPAGRAGVLGQLPGQPGDLPGQRFVGRRYGHRYSGRPCPDRPRSGCPRSGCPRSGRPRSGRPRSGRPAPAGPAPAPPAARPAPLRPRPLRPRPLRSAPLRPRPLRPPALRPPVRRWPLRPAAPDPARYLHALLLPPSGRPTRRPARPAQATERDNGGMPDADPRPACCRLATWRPRSSARLATCSECGSTAHAGRSRAG